VWLSTALVLAVSSLAVAPTATSKTGDVVACAGYGEPARGGAIEDERLVELSGLAASRRHPGVLWGHNDSGGEPELYAMDERGRSLGAYPLRGAEAIDWEDIAAGPGADGTGDHVYIGDIGDNGAERSSVTVYRVPEPDATPARPGRELTGVEAIELTYPDRPLDAEALLVDPRTGDVVIVTKSFSGSSRLLEASAADLVDGPVTMADRGALPIPLPADPGLGLPGTMVTAGDVSPDGSLVLLRTYRSVLVFEREDDQTLAEALQGEPCSAPQAEEDQGEAAAFTGDGSSYVTASEGRGATIYRVEVPASAPTTSTSTAEPSTTTSTAAPSTAAPSTTGDTVVRTSDGEDAPMATGLLVAGGALVLLGSAALLWSRRD
jgi:hypothetical protein